MKNEKKFNNFQWLHYIAGNRQPAPSCPRHCRNQRGPAAARGRRWGPALDLAHDDREDLHADGGDEREASDDGDL